MKFFIILSVLITLFFGVNSKALEENEEKVAVEHGKTF